MKTLTLIFKITFVLSIINHSFWSFIKEAWDIRIFHPTNALTFVGYLYIIYEFTKRACNVDDRFHSLLLWAEIALGAAVSNLLDEMFFDPTKLGINEYISFALIIAYTIYNDKRRKNSVRRDAQRRY